MAIYLLREICDCKLVWEINYWGFLIEKVSEKILIADFLVCFFIEVSLFINDD